MSSTSMNSKAHPSPPADLERGVAGRSQTEEVDAVVDPELSRSIRSSLDVFFVVYLLFFVGLVALMVMVSDHWWDPWPAVLVLSPICIGTLWLAAKMKDVHVQLYATVPPPGSQHGNLRTNLLESQA